jgi:transcriptional regulator with XRE-family HTH domain
MEANEVVAREIRAEMGRQELTQRELAYRLDWTPIYLWRRLHGRVSFSLDDIEAIANELHVSLLNLTWPRGERAS